MASEDKKVLAWILPEVPGRSYPVCEEGLTFGCNPKQNDVYLNSIGADICQAAISWNNGQLFLTSHSSNGLTLLGEKILLKDEVLPAPHGSCVSLGGQKFQVAYIKELTKETVAFVDDNDAEIFSGRYSIGEKVCLPEPPKKALDSRVTYTFMSWEKVSGVELNADHCCMGSCVYRAKYQKQQICTIIFSAEGGFVNSKCNEKTISCPQGSKVSFPAPEDMNIVSGQSFGQWKLVDGIGIEQGICQGNARYEMVYKRADTGNDSATIKMEAYVIPKGSVTPIPVDRYLGFSFGKCRNIGEIQVNSDNRTAFLDGSTYRFTVLSDDPVEINGKKIEKNQSLYLSGSNKVKINEQLLYLFLPESLERAYLVNGSKEKLELPQGETRLGRNLQKDFWGFSRSISRDHAAITYENGVYSIQDNNSQNGTFLNGTKLIQGQKYALKDGDILCLAGYVCTFVIA